jgi:hypothetical protein
MHGQPSVQIDLGEDAAAAAVTLTPMAASVS